MVYVLLAEGFEEIEALTPVDVLRRANIDVMTAGVGGEVVCGAHGIPVVCDTTVEQIPYDSINGIVLPGGMPGTTNLQEDEKVGEMIDFCMDNDRMIAAICAAPMILGELGLLSGRAAVCFPGFESNLHGADISDAAVAASDNIITSRGAGTALEFAAAIVDYLTGEYGAGEGIVLNMQYPYEFELAFDYGYKIGRCGKEQAPYRISENSQRDSRKSKKGTKPQNCRTAF